MAFPAFMHNTVGIIAYAPENILLGLGLAPVPRPALAMRLWSILGGVSSATALAFQLSLASSCRTSREISRPMTEHSEAHTGLVWRGLSDKIPSHNVLVVIIAS